MLGLFLHVGQLCHIDISLSFKVVRYHAALHHLHPRCSFHDTTGTMGKKKMYALTSKTNVTVFSFQKG